jgi:hypothetical protein
MRLLSKSWSIRPMSYKQFSNLVAKKNNFYKSLVKKNGEVDPLRKTLLIIDEAHKLYGGTDLSSIERPDMAALKRALLHSYAVSGRDAVKLMLMTATPITNNPMELIQLVNLFKTSEEQPELPEDFTGFSEKFLDEEGHFTASGKRAYSDYISGHVSYLNRERDARQFAQPVVQMVHSPLIRDAEDVAKMDKKYAREILGEDVVKLKNDILEEAKKLEGDLGDIDATKFAFLKDRCAEYEGKERKQCEKVVRLNIKDIMREAKAEVKKVRDAIKAIRLEIKNKNLFKQASLREMTERTEGSPKEFENFKHTNYYQLRRKCEFRAKNQTELTKVLRSHPAFMEYERELATYDGRIRELNDELKSDMVVHKSRIVQIKGLLKTGGLSAQEKALLKTNLVDAQKTAKVAIAASKKDFSAMVREIKKTKKNVEKKKKQYIVQFRKTSKSLLKERKKVERDETRAEKKLRRTKRKTGELREEIQHDFLKDLVKRYSDNIEEEFREVQEGMAEYRIAARLAKEEAKTQKAAERVEKAAEKAREKERKKAEAAIAKKEKEETRKRLAAEKVRKTMKNK